MPAVTVDNVLALPRVSTVDPAVDRPRPVVTVTTAPQGFEGEGFPVRRAFAGVDLRSPRPVHPHGPDGRGGVRPGGTQGNCLASAPRLRDRHLHDRWADAARGLARGRWTHQRRRHAVDDRRRRTAAHRGAPGAHRDEWRRIPRPAALGEPTGGPKAGGAAVPRHHVGQGVPAQLCRRRRPGSVDRRRARGRFRAWLHLHADHDDSRHGCAWRVVEPAVARGLQRVGLRTVRGRSSGRGAPTAGCRTARGVRCG